MADKTPQLITEALGRALSDPSGRPLIGAKKVGALFPPTAAARKAAQDCLQVGYLQVLRTETKGKTVREICAITDKGAAYLFEQTSPRAVLEELMRAIASRQTEVAALTAAAQSCQATLGALQKIAEKIMEQAALPPCHDRSAGVDCHKNNGHANGSQPADPIAPAWINETLEYLVQWQRSRPQEDCPLPELYRRIAAGPAAPTIGQFHDGLRRLHEQGLIYLHPWTGPLYEIPDPALALLVGHAVVYYASCPTP